MRTSKLQLTFNSSQQVKLDKIRSIFLPFTTRIYIVGGFLRDAAMGIVSDDIDIEVFGIDKELMKTIVKKYDLQVLSEKFHVYNMEGIDIALPRIEKKTSKGYHGFEIEIVDDEELSTQRRDFTVNSLMYNITQNKLLDFHGGMDDIDNKLLRAVNCDSFTDDSLRMVRAVRLMAQYGFKVHSETKLLLNQMNLDELSKSRINKELQKAFK
ncbi:MAG: hypothetical protein U9Q33_06390 [Campylobacterota bacterium]|nr:hypothetical protein [Campylobacterota bacterium]